MEFPFRLRIAKANCAEVISEYFESKDAVLSMLVDTREIRPALASMSEEELMWTGEYCIAQVQQWSVDTII